MVFCQVQRNSIIFRRQTDDDTVWYAMAITLFQQEILHNTVLEIIMS